MTKLSDIIEAEITQALNDCNGVYGGLSAREVLESAQDARAEIMWAGPMQIRNLVDEQAKDEGLWCRARTTREAYLQAALRQLHEEVERYIERVP